jgi:branched-chain amino acid transport system permease protein
MVGGQPVNYVLHFLIYFAIYAILALSLNLAVGYCGKLTLAHATYFAIGSYAYALITLRLGWGFLEATLLGVALAIVLSLVVSLPAPYFGTDSFVLLSLAVQVLFYSLFYNWASPGKEIGTLANLTNGSYGIAGVPGPLLFGHRVDGIAGSTATALILAAFCAFLAWLLVNSPWGRLLKCMRDDEAATRALGKNIRLANVQTFAFACGLAALAGVLYASYVGYIDPSSADIDQSILMLAMVLVGGSGSFAGPLLGAGILLAIPEILRFAHLSDAIVANLRLMFYGLLLAFLMHVRPQGIAGKFRME